MEIRGLEREIIGIGHVLENEAYDFSAKYLALRELRAIAQKNPDILGPETLSALRGILKDTDISRQTQSYFLFKEAALTLCSSIAHSREGQRAEEAYSGIMGVLRETTGHAQRATAEALGSLPFTVKGPELRERPAREIPHVKWEDVLNKGGITTPDVPVFMGRSLVVTTPKENRLLVVKLALAKGRLESMFREAAWLEHFSSRSYYFSVKFQVPVIMKVRGSHLFRLRRLPLSPTGGMEIHPELYAIGFIAHKDYFTYPNSGSRRRGLGVDEFKEVIFRNAWLLGKLASLGIVHSAPIPLFHNRVQGIRREDNGLYEWQRAGRLDRWLHSCAYPNFGPTGIRDFEHLVPFRGRTLDLYQHIGTHLLGLSLVVGSYFRNKDRNRVGFDREGKPVDARDLFDKILFKALIQGVFMNYYHGFVGKEYRGMMPFDLDALSSRMIEEMGIDHHMDEILRAVDQREMTDEEFTHFLTERGYDEEQVRGLKKGVEDIVIHTGPHLGGFNQRISLPDFIESVGSMSALCILGRYRQQVFLSDPAHPK